MHMFLPFFEHKELTSGPRSSEVRAFTSGAVDHRVDPWPCHTEGNKNGTGSSLADTRNKG